MDLKRFLTANNTRLWVFLAFVPSPAFASAAEGAGGFQSILYPLINFFIFFGILSVIVKKPISRAWKLRHEVIDERLTRADSILAEAKQSLAAAQAERDGLAEQIDKLKHEIQAHTNEEVQQIELQSKERIEGLKKEIAQKMLIQEKAILNEIYSSVVDEVMSLTRAALTKQLDSSKDHKLAVDRFAALDVSKLDQFIKTSREEN